MNSSISQVLAIIATTVLLAAVGQTDANRRPRPFIPGKSNPKPAPVASEPTQDTRVPDSNLADIERRMADVELSTSVMKQELRQAKSENSRLQEELNSMGVVMRELDEAHQRVNELQRMLRKFENFFGVLYIELPDDFAREMTIEKRMSALNEFIGNREAELVALRPSPPVATATPDESPVDQELVGAALQQLSSDNEKMRRRLDDMEKRDTLVGGGQRINFDGLGTVDEPSQETQERLTRLERLVALQLAPVLDEEEEENRAPTDGNAGKRLAPSEDATQRLALSDSDTDILRDELNSVRSLSSTRKSLFSVAATTHQHGEPRVSKPVIFDHIYANKGRHFEVDNSTFNCAITGFYLFSFTVRSYDHRFLGVSLVHNGEHVTSVSGEKDPEKNQMMTQTVILHVRAGDRLWLVLSPANIFSIYSDHNKFCTFSGALLFKGS